MGQFLHVFCLSDEALTCGEVMDFITEGSYFDDDPRYHSAGAGVNRSATDWCVDVFYEAGRRPVQLCFGPANDLTCEVIEEVFEAHGAKAVSREQLRLLARLKNTRQELVIEVGSGIPDECWEMLDHLEAYVASKLDGVVYDYEKFYDATLRPVWVLSRGAGEAGS
jgi:hypothetical protein